MAQTQVNNSEVTTRLAVKSDAPALADLRYALRSTTGIATEPEAEFIKRCTSWMEAHLQDEARLCWVAEINQRLIAASGCSWSKRFPIRGLSRNIMLTSQTFMSKYRPGERELERGYCALRSTGARRVRCTRSSSGPPNAAARCMNDMALRFAMT